MEEQINIKVSPEQSPPWATLGVAQAQRGPGPGCRASLFLPARRERNSIEGEGAGRARSERRDSNLSSVDRNLHGRVYGIDKVLSGSLTGLSRPRRR